MFKLQFLAVMHTIFIGVPFNPNSAKISERVFRAILLRIHFLNTCIFVLNYFLMSMFFTLLKHINDSNSAVQREINKKVKKLHVFLDFG